MGSWLPLESNPDVLNPFCKTLGMPDDWAVCDVFGLDPDLLAMLPQPCKAICLLYPSKNISAPRRESQRSVLSSQPPPPPSLFFTMQHDGIGNACGTLACMHAVANGIGADALKDGPLKKFMQATKAMGIAARGKELLLATELQSLSDATAASGETAGAGTDDAQDQHFIAFVIVDDMLYELDGRNFDKSAESAEAAPFCHGGTTDATFLADAAKVIQVDVMARDPESVNFNIVALCKVD